MVTTKKQPGKERRAKDQCGKAQSMYTVSRLLFRHGSQAGSEPNETITSSFFNNKPIRGCQIPRQKASFNLASRITRADAWWIETCRQFHTWGLATNKAPPLVATHHTFEGDMNCRFSWMVKLIKQHADIHMIHSHTMYWRSIKATNWIVLRNKLVYSKVLPTWQNMVWSLLGVSISNLDNIFKSTEVSTKNSKAASYRAHWTNPMEVIRRKVTG